MSLRLNEEQYIAKERNDLCSPPMYISTDVTKSTHSKSSNLQHHHLATVSSQSEQLSNPEIRYLAQWNSLSSDEEHTHGKHTPEIKRIHNHAIL